MMPPLCCRVTRVTLPYAFERYVLRAPLPVPRHAARHYADRGHAFFFYEIFTGRGARAAQLLRCMRRLPLRQMMAASFALFCRLYAPARAPLSAGDTRCVDASRACRAV